MSYRGTRSSAEKEKSQNNPLHGQASSSFGIGQATSGGSVSLAPCGPPRDQDRDDQEERDVTSVSQTTLKPRPTEARSGSVLRPPSISSGDLMRRLKMARAPWATRSVCPTSSPVDDIPPSPAISSMTFTREMQHYNKDANNFYADADADETADYPSTPLESNSGFSSPRCSRNNQRSRGDMPTYDQNGAKGVNQA